jgi:hypothetical protein
MGFSLKKRKKILPGVTLNISTKSIGLRVGGRNAGASINSRTGARVGASIPGTGISVSQRLTGSSQNGQLETFQPSSDSPNKSNHLRYFWAAIALPLASIASLLCFALGVMLCLGAYWIVGVVMLFLAIGSLGSAVKAFKVFRPGKRVDASNDVDYP